MKFTRRGLVATANTAPNKNECRFIITLAPVESLNGKHTIFGEVVEGLEVLEQINKAYVDTQKGNFRPLQNIRIKHTTVIDDPFEGRDA